ERPAPRRVAAPPGPAAPPSEGERVYYTTWGVEGSQTRRRTSTKAGQDEGRPGTGRPSGWGSNHRQGGQLVAEPNQAAAPRRDGGVGVEQVGGLAQQVAQQVAGARRGADADGDGAAGAVVQVDAEPQHVQVDGPQAQVEDLGGGGRVDVNVAGAGQGAEALIE